MAFDLATDLSQQGSLILPPLLEDDSSHLNSVHGFSIKEPENDEDRSVSSSLQTSPTIHKLGGSYHCFANMFH